MRVRYMDWNDDLQRLNRRSTGEQDANGACSGDVRGASPERDEGQLPPGLGSRESFDVILGSDVLYEVCQAPVASFAADKYTCMPGPALLSPTQTVSSDTSISFSEGVCVRDLFWPWRMQHMQNVHDITAEHVLVPAAPGCAC